MRFCRRTKPGQVRARIIWKRAPKGHGRAVLYRRRFWGITVGGVLVPVPDGIFSGPNPGSIRARIGVFRTAGSCSSGNGVDARQQNRYNRVFPKNTHFNPFKSRQNSVDLRPPGFGIDLQHLPTLIFAVTGLVFSSSRVASRVSDPVPDIPFSKPIPGVN